MAKIETIALVQGDERIVVNLGDQETWLAAGWLKEGDEGIVEGAKAVGGGWYELPDGTRVQGKAKAVEALAKLQAANSQQ